MSSESKPPSKASRPRRDDLPAVKASRLRKLGYINPDMAGVRLELAGHLFDVRLAHRRFPNGGSWSFFICPCGRRAQTLRLLESPAVDGRPIARLVCRSCDGLLARCQTSDRQNRTGNPAAIARLIARLESRPQRARAKLELSLRRKLIVERRRRLGPWLRDK